MGISVPRDEAEGFVCSRKLCDAGVRSQVLPLLPSGVAGVRELTGSPGSASVGAPTTLSSCRVQHLYSNPAPLGSLLQGQPLLVVSCLGFWGCSIF